jgi:hypothetical protein
MDVKEAVDRLKIGMTKAELDKAFKKVQFLREQVVMVYPGQTEEGTRANVWNNRDYEEVNPKDFITHQLAFDGNTKVYSYFVSRKKKFANPDTITCIIVFVDQKADRVIGWACLSTWIDPKNWHDLF